MKTRRLALVVEYEGTRFFGFQAQARCRTVQQELEKAASRICGEPIKVVAAGRTDAGVHARGQVICFETASRISTDKMPLAMNSVLPADVAVCRARQVAHDFRPRRARKRVYQYLIDNGRIASVLERRTAHPVAKRLDVPRMQRAADALVGNHDFRAFQGAGSPAKTTTRELFSVRCARRGRWVTITVEGTAFLYQMVRTLVGTLMEVGLGKREPEDVARILGTKDRKQAGPTAPARGLCLMRVQY